MIMHVKLPHPLGGVFVAPMCLRLFSIVHVFELEQYCSSSSIVRFLSLFYPQVEKQNKATGISITIDFFFLLVYHVQFCWFIILE